MSHLIATFSYSHNIAYGIYLKTFSAALSPYHKILVKHAMHEKAAT